MSTFDRLQQIVAATLKVQPGQITEATRDEDLPSWDSLGQVNLIMALEQEFGVYVEVDDFGTLNSVPAMLEYLRRHGVA